MPVPVRQELCFYLEMPNNSKTKVELEMPAPLSSEEIRVGLERGMGLPFDRVLATLAQQPQQAVRAGITEVAQAGLDALMNPERPFTDQDIINSYDAVKARLEQMERNCTWLLKGLSIIRQCLRPDIRMGSWQDDVRAAVQGAQSAKRLLDTMRQERPRDPKQAHQDTTDLKRYEAGLFLASIHDMVFGEMETRTDEELIAAIQAAVGLHNALAE